MTPRMVPITCHCTLKKLGKKGQLVCNLVKKTQEGGACFFFQEGGGGISKGGHVSSFERGGPLAWEVHWQWGGGVGHLVHPQPPPLYFDPVNIVRKLQR